jgi:hypothetical protein
MSDDHEFSQRGEICQSCGGSMGSCGLDCKRIKRSLWEKIGEINRSAIKDLIARLPEYGSERYIPSENYSQTVSVLRSNGQWDDGWYVTGYIGQYVIVCKFNEQNEPKTAKVVSQEQYRATAPETVFVGAPKKQEPKTSEQPVEKQAQSPDETLKTIQALKKIPYGYFTVFGLTANCSVEELSHVRLALLKKYHPDRANNDPIFVSITAEINEVYNVLKDPASRKRYEGQQRDRALRGAAVVETPKQQKPVEPVKSTVEKQEESEASVKERVRQQIMIFLKKQYPDPKTLCKNPDSLWGVTRLAFFGGRFALTLINEDETFRNGSDLRKIGGEDKFVDMVVECMKVYTRKS